MAAYGEKRSVQDFFSPKGKKPKSDATIDEISDDARRSDHDTYPFSIPHLPTALQEELSLVPAVDAKAINDRPDLDLLYYRPFIEKDVAKRLFTFLRRELFFYRVQYKINRFGKETSVNTPRFTTVFGLDSTSKLASDGKVIDSVSTEPVPAKRYACKPRPLPQCLDFLRQLTEAFTAAEYNFCLVNYYASGVDSISYHSDDEHFLGPEPSIASFSLGAARDFCMKHKPLPKGSQEMATEPVLKLPLLSGDMILMRGPTQANWLHSIPKRSGKASDGGRINITFRKGIKPYATENYMRYNVGDGPVYKWHVAAAEMRMWTADAA